jgi:hypothetical protein
MILGILFCLRYVTSFVAILSNLKKGRRAMWEEGAAAQKSAKIAENGREGAKASEYHEMEKTEKESAASRRGLVEGVS